MTTDPREAAASYLATLTDEGALAFLAEARTPVSELQVTEADLKKMTPGEINRARHAGRLDNLLNGA